MCKLNCYYMIVISVLIVIISINIKIYFLHENYEFFEDDFSDLTLKANCTTRLNLSNYDIYEYEIDSSNRERVLNNIFNLLYKIFPENFLVLSKNYNIKNIFGEGKIISSERIGVKTYFSGNQVFETRVKLLDLSGEHFITTIYILCSFSGIITLKDEKKNYEIFLTERGEKRVYKRELITFDLRLVKLITYLQEKTIINSNKIENHNFNFTEHLLQGLLNSLKNKSSIDDKLLLINQLNLISQFIFNDSFHHIGHVKKGYIKGKVTILHSDGIFQKLSLNKATVIYEALITFNLNERKKSVYVYFIEGSFNILLINSESDVYFFPMDRFGVNINKESYKIIHNSYYHSKFYNTSRILKEFSEKNSNLIRQKVIEYSTQYLNISDSEYYSEALNKQVINKRFILESLDINNISQVNAGLNIASTRAFGSKFIRVVSFRKGIAYGIMEVLQPDGTIITLTFEGKSVKQEILRNNQTTISIYNVPFILEGEVLFKKNEIGNETILISVYYFSECFNPVRFSHNITSQVTFFPLDEEGEISNNGEKISENINIPEYNIIFNDSMKDLKKKIIAQEHEYSRKEINVNDEKFQEEVLANTQNNKKFIIESINYEDKSSVSAAINVASQRAFSSRFLRLISYRKGVAYGEMEVLQPDGLSKIFTFEGKNVKYKIIDSSGKLVDTFVNDYPHIYEGIAEFKKDDNFETNHETIVLTVYYFSQCFNPLRYSSDTKVNVSFFPDDEENESNNVVIKLSEEYNQLFNSCKEELYKKNHKEIKLGKSTISVMMNQVVYGIIDISGSMYYVGNEAKRQAIAIVGEKNLQLFNGCYFGLINQDTLTSRIYEIVRITQNLGAIYIFADFQDYVHPDTFSILFPILKEKNIKLYLNSLELPPNPILVKISETSGGKITVNKIK